jgi:succinate dehydrogenase/fumarate reductase flavoprotein subunit
MAAEGGAAGVIRDDDTLSNHFDDTVSGGDWLCDQDAVQYFIEHSVGAAAGHELCDRSGPGPQPDR